MEKNGIITGYFMKIDPTKFGFSTYKLLLRVQNLKKSEEFEKYLTSLKNVIYITKMHALI